MCWRDCIDNTDFFLGPFGCTSCIHTFWWFSNWKGVHSAHIKPAVIIKKMTSAHPACSLSGFNFLSIETRMAEAESHALFIR